MNEQTYIPPSMEVMHTNIKVCLPMFSTSLSKIYCCLLIIQLQIGILFEDNIKFTMKARYDIQDEGIEIWTAIRNEEFVFDGADNFNF